MKHDRLIKNNKTFCFIKDYYKQYTLKFNKLTDEASADSTRNLTFSDFIALVNSIENSIISEDFINEFDRLTSVSTTNQSININNKNEEAFKNIIFYTQRFIKSHVNQQALTDL